MNGRTKAVELDFNREDMQKLQALEAKLKNIPKTHLASLGLEEEEFSVLTEACSFFGK